MLTKTDLKQIKKTLDDSIRQQVPPLIEKAVKPLIEKAVKPLQKDISQIKKDITKIRRDIDVIVNFFDREYLELRTRVDRIETFLKLPPVNYA